MPELIIEVLSSNKVRDQVEKKKLYQEYGVKEYLIVNQFDETVEYNFLESGMYKSTLHDKEDTIGLQTIPGLEIQISDVFLQ